MRKRRSTRLRTHSFYWLLNALELSPHDARRATDADPASGPWLNDTATSRPILTYHDLPRAVAGVDAPAESLSAIGCVQPQHSERTIAPRSYKDRGG